MVRCTRCGKSAQASPLHNVCRQCYQNVQSHVVTSEEDTYLARWLSSRVDERGKPLEDSALVQGNRRLVARLVARARKRRVDWVHPPEPRTTEQVMNMVIGRSAPKRGAKRRAENPLAG